MCTACARMTHRRTCRYADGTPAEKPITWIKEMIETLAFREEGKKALPMPGLKSIQCTTGMCVFEKCAAHENGVDGQDCGDLTRV
jgi:hypothetical protein